MRTRACLCDRFSIDIALFIDTLDEPNDLNLHQRFCYVTHLFIMLSASLSNVRKLIELVFKQPFYVYPSVN